MIKEPRSTGWMTTVLRRDHLHGDPEDSPLARSQGYGQPQHGHDIWWSWAMSELVVVYQYWSMCHQFSGPVLVLYLDAVQKNVYIGILHISICKEISWNARCKYHQIPMWLLNATLRTDIALGSKRCECHGTSNTARMTSFPKTSLQTLCECLVASLGDGAHPPKRSRVALCFTRTRGWRFGSPDPATHNAWFGCWR